MGYTLAEAIIASHTDQEVKVGNICSVKVDFVFANDITSPPAINSFYEMGAASVFDPKRCAILPDHFTPNRDVKSAQQCKVAREFAKKQGMLYWEVGEVGVEHTFLPEQGLILPGEIVLGADSHTCTGGALGALATGMGSTDIAAAWALGETWLMVAPTIRVFFDGDFIPSYIMGKDIVLKLISQMGVDGANYRILEYHGDIIKYLSMDDRFTISNMAIECGAKSGIFVPDERINNYVKERAKREYKVIYPDKNAVYESEIHIDVENLVPLVAAPFSPANVKPASELNDIKVDQVFIGSCTNGRLKDIMVAAKMLEGKSIADGVRLIVIPSSYEVYIKSLELGYIDTIIKAGAVICTPTCGPCLGGHLGVLAEGEVCVSTTNRNFVGRMGHPKSLVYLASPMVATASAITGRITDPRELFDDDFFKGLEVCC